MVFLWSLEGIEIDVTGHNVKDDVKLAKLTPLDSEDTSVLHFFGAGAEEVSLKGKIFSDANVVALKNFRKAGTSVTLVSHRGSEGDYKIKSVSLDEYGPFAKLSLAGYPDEPDEVSIYNFNIDLIKV